MFTIMKESKLRKKTMLKVPFDYRLLKRYAITGICDRNVLPLSLNPSLRLKARFLHRNCQSTHNFIIFSLISRQREKKVLPFLHSLDQTD